MCLSLNKFTNHFKDTAYPTAIFGLSVLNVVDLILDNGMAMICF